MSPDFLEGALCGASAAAAVWAAVALARRWARFLATADWELACLEARFPGEARTAPTEEP